MAKLLIWGSTPLATYLAAQWHPQHEVTWLAEETTRQAIEKAGGITLGTQKITGLNLITDLKAAPKPDAIILAAPAWFTSEAIQQLSRFPSLPPVLLLQMGVGNLAKIESLWGRGQALAGVVTKPLHFLTSTDGHNAPLRSTLRVGRWGGVALQHDHAQSMTMATWLGGAGLAVQLEAAESLQWSSVLWGIQANAIATILDLPPAQVYHDPALFAYEHQQLAEAWLIIRRAGIPLIRLPGVNVPQIAQAIQWLPARLLRWALARPPRPPSLRDDLLLNTRRSEAAYLNGAVAIKADQMNLQAPINHALALTVTDIAEGRALWSQYKNNPHLLFATLRLARG